MNYHYYTHEFSLRLGIMIKFNNTYRIDSNRLRHWDYSSSGRYFITICVENRECVLGDIKNGEMILSEYGEIVKHEIVKMNDYNIRAIIDRWVVMPNHIHLLIELTDDKNNEDGGIVERIHEFSLLSSQQPPLPSIHQWWRDLNYEPTMDEILQYRKHRRQMIIPRMVGKLQMQTSKQINVKRNTPGIKNWQSNYYDHIIRDNESYHRIKNYIINNPENWDTDKFK